MKQIISYASLILMMFTLNSCKKDNNTDNANPPGSSSGVYIGYSTGYQHYNRVAKYWHNGQEALLLDRTSNVYIDDLAVAANGDVYTSGCECTWNNDPLAPNEKNDSCRITLWKNQVRQQLTQVPFYSITQAYVFITPAGDIYVAGTENNGATGSGTIRLWKNGIPSDVTNGSTDDEVRCLFVNGNDVYIGGSQRILGATNVTATLWRNGVPQSLSATTSYYDAVLSIQVSGSDVYASVQEATTGFVVKNGIKLSQPSGIEDIKNVFLQGNDLYVLGKPSSTATSVWKNGTLLHNLVYNGISDSYDGGQKMYVKGGDVYVSGASRISGSDNVVLWKNGTIVNNIASPPGNFLITAKGLVVK